MGSFKLIIQLAKTSQSKITQETLTQSIDMESSSDIEVEPYEEVVEHFPYPTPYNGRSCSPVAVAVASTVQSDFYEPIEKTGRVDSQSTELFAPPRGPP